MIVNAGRKDSWKWLSKHVSPVQCKHCSTSCAGRNGILNATTLRVGLLREWSQKAYKSFISTKRLSTVTYSVWWQLLSACMQDQMAIHMVHD